MAIKTLFALLLTLIVFDSLAVDKSLKERAHQLDKSNGAGHESLVSEATQKAKHYDLDKVNEILASENYQQRLANNQAFAQQALGLKKYAQVANKQEAQNVLGDRVVLFVSASMPLHVLRNYARDLEKVDGVMVFRGTVDGIDSFQPTMQLMQSLLAKSSTCTGNNCPIMKTNVSIDPERFAHHQIARVPALIFEKDMKIQAYCQASEQPNPASIVVYGDASLLGMSEMLYRQSQVPGLKPIIDRLRKGAI